MVLRLLVLVCFILFLAAGYLKGGEVQDKECIQMPCSNGYENACVLRGSNKIEVKGTECVPEKPEDACYKQHGVCEKVENGCGWKHTSKLDECLSMVRAASAIRNVNNFKMKSY